MKKIVLARIDDRLIHGQVVTGWLKLTRGNHIFIVDDKLKNDALMQMVLKTATPQGTKLKIFAVDEAIEELKKPEAEKELVVILAKTPDVFEELINGGVEIPKIILGGMGMTGGRKTFYKNVAASGDEIESMRRIVSKGTQIIYQLVPDEASKDIKSLL